MKYVKGNLLDAEEKIIIHGVNTMGVMGAGVAKALADKYPNLVERYRNHIVEKGGPEKVLGTTYIYRGKPNDPDHKVIGNLFTQETVGWFGSHAKLEHIQHALENLSSQLFLASWISHHQYKSIAMPKIGCGLGGLKWDDVKEIFEDFEKVYGIQFVVYELE